MARPERKGDWATALELEAAVRACAEKHEAWGVRKVHASLRRRGTVASRKRVWGVMNRLGLVLPAPERCEEGARRGSVAVPESNRRWATDLTTVWTREDGLVALVPGSTRGPDGARLRAHAEPGGTCRAGPAPAGLAAAVRGTRPGAAVSGAAQRPRAAVHGSGLPRAVRWVERRSHLRARGSPDPATPSPSGSC
jgi:hypothetical protein